MKLGTQIATTIHPCEIYPGIQVSEEELVCLSSQINALDGIFTCARLNRIITHKDITFEEKRNYILTRFFPGDEVRLACLKAFSPSNHGIRVLSFRAQILNLMKEIILHAPLADNDGSTFIDKTVRDFFSKALLISGEVWALSNWHVLRKEPPQTQEARFRGLPGFRRNLEGTSEVPNPSRSIGRGWAIFSHYLPQVLPQFTEKIVDGLNMSIEDYFIALAIFLSHFVLPKKDDSIFNYDDFGKENNAHPILEKFISIHSTTLKSLKSHLSNSPGDGLVHLLNHLRDFPILTVNDGRAIILDPCSLSSLGSVGFIFRLPDSFRSTGISAFGEAVEKYSQEILSVMFPKERLIGHPHLERNYTNSKKGLPDFEVDAFVDFPQDVCLFEIKNAFIPDNRIIETDPGLMQTALIERYSLKPSGKLAGVGQLAEKVKLILDEIMERPFYSSTPPQRIFSILLVYDDLLSSPGIGEFLSKQFWSHLRRNAPDTSYRKIRNILVYSPIVLTISDLEDLENTVQQAEFLEILTSYSNDGFDGFLTFHDFLAMGKFKEKLRPSTTPVKYGKEILELAMQRIRKKDDE